MKVFKWNFFVFLLRCLMILFWVGIISGILLFSRLNFMDSERSLTVLSWYDTLDREYLKKFEEKTGIKIYLSNYATNEELLVKLRASRGHGYDLIIPSDYAVKQLVAENLLMKIDKQRLPFFTTLNPLLLGHSFDPENEYTIPFEWELYMLGLNSRFINPSTITREHAWDLVFRPENFGEQYRFTMVNDPLDAINLASNYLFGNLLHLSLEQIVQVQALLSQQRNWIEAYTDVQPDYFLCTDNSAVAAGQSSAIWRAMIDCEQVDFVVPSETFISIENFAIPVASKKTDMVYELLDFLFTPESYQWHFEEQRFCPARLDIIDDVPATERQKTIMRSSPEEFSRYHFIKDLVSDQQKNNIWIAVKS
jgi:spermidine/putrescine transport system substrate-binding protein